MARTIASAAGCYQSGTRAVAGIKPRIWFVMAPHPTDRPATTNMDQDHIKVRLLCVPNCPLVTKVQKTLKGCCEKTIIPVTVEELVGAYNSPTVAINGFDVTGQPLAEEGQASCRLDIPNQEQILAAIRGLSVLRCEDEVAAELLAKSFGALLNSGKRFSAESLNDGRDRETGATMKRLKALQQAGLVQIDADGFIVGAAGLTLTPTKHEMSIDGRKFWAWCAFDVLGIFGALEASGSVRSVDPSTNEIIVVSFVTGVPQDMDLALWMGDPAGGLSIRDGWCSKVNFFRSKTVAEAWMGENAGTGSLFIVGNVIPVAREAWRRAVMK